ncbi:MAG TPA: hypothetical protein DDW17_05395 [Deltaproteobacteria bacterium]|nr:hypothetical protein [Deltaproteobacteria bacterium]
MRVLVLGGGITGLKTAFTLSEFDIETIIVEKSSEIGGKVKRYDKIFPDFRSGKNLVKNLIASARNSPNITVLENSTVTNVAKNNRSYTASLSDGKIIEVDAIILTCGFEVFDATRQPEYGYSVYPNVITSMELESFLNPEGPTKGKLLRPSDGKVAKRIAIIFCVGSRNMKIGNPYCSRICCSYSTKQAIEIKENDEEAMVTCFYMDIRTYGRGFEEMYQYAQEIGVKYIRGRVSECSVLPDGNIQVRAENTLLGKPVQGVFDLVSLSVGMMPCVDAEELAGIFGIERGKDGFFLSKDDDLFPHDTSKEGVFLAGSITGLKPIRDCFLDAMSVSGRVVSYLTDLYKNR